MTRARRHVLRVATLVGLLVSLSPLIAGTHAAHAAQSRYGNVLFTAPAGWTRSDQPSGILFIAPASSKGVAVLAVLKGSTLTGSFKAWFEATIKGSLNAGDKVVDQTADTATRAAGSYDVLYTVRVVQSKSGLRSYRFFLGADPGNRAEMIAFFAQSEEAFRQYQQVLQDFIAGIHFANLPAKPSQKQPSAPQPAPQPGTSISTGGVTIYFGEKGDVVHLAFTSGAAEDHVFFILPGQSGAEAIAIDGTVYLEQH
jgi:hypothetical protein